MSSFGSSVINKSSKKLAPKAPIARRRPPAAPVDADTSPVATNSSGTDDALTDVLPAASQPAQDNAHQSHGASGNATQITSAILVPSATVDHLGRSHAIENLVRDDGQFLTRRLRRTSPSDRIDMNPGDDAKRRRTTQTTRDVAHTAGGAEIIAGQGQTSSQALTLAQVLLAQQQDSESPQPSTNETVEASGSVFESQELDSSVERLESRRQAGSSLGAEENLTRTSRKPVAKQKLVAKVPNAPSRSSRIKTRSELAKGKFVDGTSSADALQRHEDMVAPTSTQPKTKTTQAVTSDDTSPPPTNVQTIDGRSTSPAVPMASDAAKSKKRQYNRKKAAATSTMQTMAEEGQEVAAQPRIRVMRKAKQSKMQVAAFSAVAGEGDVQQHESVVAGTLAPARLPRRRRRPKAVASQPPELQSDVEDPDLSREDATLAPQDTGVGSNLDEHDYQQDHQDIPVRKRKRKRAETPEDAANHEIDTKSVTMFDLCKDRKRGKKSKLEGEFQNIDWSEVVKRRKEAEARARANGKKASDTARELLDEAGAEPPVPAGPQLQLRDGQIVLDSSSLVINRHTLPDQDQPAVEESDLTKRINSRSWLYDNRRDPDDRFFRRSAKWSTDEEEVFYGALRMFGTDFDMISKMFPHRTRRMIKQKFVREERTNEGRIRRTLLGQPDPINLQTYCNATDKPMDYYKDPEALNKELQEAEEQQRAEIERERQEQVQIQKRKQEAAQAKAEAASRRKAGEKVPRKKRKRKDQDGETQAEPERQPELEPETASGAIQAGETATQRVAQKVTKRNGKVRQGESRSATKKARKVGAVTDTSRAVEVSENQHEGDNTADKQVPGNAADDDDDGLGEPDDSADIIEEEDIDQASEADGGQNEIDILDDRYTDGVDEPMDSIES